MKKMSEKEILEFTKKNLICANEEYPQVCDDTVSFEDFSNQIRNNLLKNIQGRKILYLDTKYWVEFRKVTMNVSTNTDYSSLLKIIKEKVSQGKLICPISTTMFLELIRQTDEKTKYATATLMQELSLGIGFCFLFERMYKEELNFFLNLKNQKIDKNIFDNANFVIGNPMIKLLNNSNSKEELRLKKSFLVWMSKIPFNELVNLIATEQTDIDFENSENEKAAKALNDYKTANPNMKDKDLLLFLIKTIFTGYSKDIGKAFIESEKIANNKQYVNCDEKNSLILAALLAHFIDTKKNFKDGLLDCFYIRIYLFYLLMKNKNRNIEPHDFNDISHASEAIASSDFFFTEKFLSHELNNEKPSLAKEYNICVCNKPKDALNALSLV